MFFQQYLIFDFKVNTFCAFRHCHIHSLVHIWCILAQGLFLYVCDRQMHVRQKSFYLHRLHQLIFWKNATSFFRFQYHQILKIHRLCILYHNQGKKYFLNIRRKVFFYVQNVLSTYICLSFFNVSDNFWWFMCLNTNLLKIFHRIS